MGGIAIGDAGKSPHAAGDYHHGFGRIGTASHVGPNIVVGLLLNFAGRLAEQLLHQIAPAFETEFFSENAQGTIGGDEIYGFYSLVTFYGQQEMLEE